jgi:hypothetical protein
MSASLGGSRYEVGTRNSIVSPACIPGGTVISISLPEPGRLILRTGWERGQIRTIRSQKEIKRGIFEHGGIGMTKKPLGETTTI